MIASISGAETAERAESSDMAKLYPDSPLPLGIPAMLSIIPIARRLTMFFSDRVLYYACSYHGRRRISLPPTAADVAAGKQESASNSGCCKEIGQSSHAQG